jgi:hypothetical protein
MKYLPPKITEKQLIAKFSYMFQGVDPMEPISMFGIECGEGWNNLLDNLMTKISTIDTEKEVRVQQIKSKFASLRFYYYGPSEKDKDDKIQKLVEEAEDLSIKTCEECGRPGKVRGKGWIYVACDRCQTKRSTRRWGS